jgi:hypothetical protein
MTTWNPQMHVSMCFRGNLVLKQATNDCGIVRSRIGKKIEKTSSGGGGGGNGVSQIIVGVDAPDGHFRCEGFRDVQRPEKQG